MTREAPTLNRAGAPTRPASPAPRPAPVSRYIPGPVVTAYAIRGSHFLALRTAANLTQREVDIRTAENGERVSVHTIERIEQEGDGVVRVSVETAQALAKALGKNVADICG